MEHTLGKWTVHIPTKTDKRLMILHPDGERLIALLDVGFDSPKKGPIPEQERIANAEFVVRACNSYEALVEALKMIAGCGGILTGAEASCFVEIAKRAIAQAEGKEGE